MLIIITSISILAAYAVVKLYAPWVIGRDDTEAASGGELLLCSILKRD